MDKRINLIPTEMAVPARAVKLAKIINKFSTIATILLILASVILGSLFFYYSLERTKIKNNTESLISRISSLQVSEQKLVLAKDRLAKIKIVRDSKSVNNEILRYQEFSNIIANATGSAITEAVLTSKGTDVSIIFVDSASLSEVLSPLSKLTNYKKIILSSLGFNPNTGFLANILLQYEY